MITLTTEQIQEFEDKKSSFMVKEPWDDPFCKKIGLTNMYVEDSIAETLGISAEQDPDDCINKPNKQFEEFHNLITEFMDKKSHKTLLVFKEFCECYINSKIQTNITWKDYLPDIRLLDNIDQMLSWLEIKYVEHPTDT